MPIFESEKFYRHKLSQKLYFCIGKTPRGNPVLMKLDHHDINEESNPFLLPEEGWGFYEDV